MLPEFSFGEYWLVFNVLSLAIAGMFAAFVFFLRARSYVAPRYHIALYLSVLIVFIAGYRYLRIFESWVGACQLQGGVSVPTGKPFNDFYPGGAVQEGAMQIGYSLPDLIAKSIYSLPVFAIARAESREERLGGKAMAHEGEGPAGALLFLPATKPFLSL